MRHELLHKCVRSRKSVCVCAHQQDQTATELRKKEGPLLAFRLLLLLQLLLYQFSLLFSTLQLPLARGHTPGPITSAANFSRGRRRSSNKRAVRVRRIPRRKLCLEALPSLVVVIIIHHLLQKEGGGELRRRIGLSLRSPHIS